MSITINSAYQVTETTDQYHAYSGVRLTPGWVKWVEETPEMTEDIGEWFLPMGQWYSEDGTPVVLIGDHRYSGSYCTYCGLGSLDWDLQEYPCNRD